MFEGKPEVVGYLEQKLMDKILSAELENLPGIAAEVESSYSTIISKIFKWRLENGK